MDGNIHWIYKKLVSEKCPCTAEKRTEVVDKLHKNEIKKKNRSALLSHR